MNHDKIFVSLDELIVDIFVIGYPDKGESQVIILRDTENIYFSCVIDCYRYNNINKTIETLNNNNVSHLDLFIWTHTDEDHSLDIEKLITSHCDNKTLFILPELTYGNMKDFIDYSDEIKKSLDLINSFNVNNTYNVSSTSVAPQGHSSIWKNQFIDKKNSSKLIFEIISVAPCSALLRRRFQSGELKKKNDLSIATIFKIGELNLFLSSDIENQTINQIANYHFETLQYIKTPHHTSPTSTNFIDKFLSNSENKALKSVSTIYKRHNLPHPDVVNEYKKISNCFYSTGYGKHDSGINHTRFNVLTNEIIEERVFGNCEKIF